MKTLLTLAIITMIIMAGYWYFAEARQQANVRQAEREIVEGAEHLTDALHEKLKSFSLRSDDIKEEISRTGKVARKMVKDLGAAVAEGTADVRVTAAIKTKLVADPDLSALRIAVSTTHGFVTLSGTVATYEEIGKAMLIALETEGVREVVSTLQVRQLKS